MTCITLLALLSALPITLATPTTSSSTYIQYSTVPGYFLQDLNSTNATTFSYTATNFGLINQSYPTDDPTTSNTLTQWQRFAHFITHLNTHAPSNTQYKLLFLGRHGEGYHNAAESYYGTPAWNCYWSLLSGNSTTTWSDAHLTPSGISQALTAHTLWSRLLTTQQIPLPQSHYVSPLYRCLTTANLTFFGLPSSITTSFNPTIKSRLRESISEHTCDRRSNKTFIHASFPDYLFEPGFPEYDQLWTGVTAETDSAQDLRSKELLDDVFGHDCDGRNKTYISFTSHSGEIASILRVLGHRVFGLSTGAVIPVLVKVERVEIGQVTTTFTGGTWTASAHCTVPPVRSVSGGVGGGCVCPNGAKPVTVTLGGTGIGTARATATATAGG